MTSSRRLTLAFLRAARRERLSATVYQQLLAEIFKSMPGYFMLTVAGLIFVGYATVQDPSPTWMLLCAGMVLVSLGRLAIFYAYKKQEGVPAALRAASTASWESTFAVVSVCMALVISAAVTLFSQSAEVADVICALILSMGIAGGISGRNGSRPKIAYVQVGIIIIPLIVSMACRPATFRAVSCGLLTIFMMATYLSIKAFYTSLRASFEKERHVQSLAIKLKRSSDLFQVALDNMTSGLLLFDRNRRVLIANERVRETLGRDLVKRIMGRATYDFHQEVFDEMGMGREEGDALKAEFGRIMEGEREGHATMIDHRRGRIFELRMMPIPNQGAVMNVDDVTEKRSKDKEIFRLAHYDVLTGLPNRFTFEQHLKDLCRIKPRRDLVVCYLDLDKFKAINDDLGHHSGDELLRVVAARIDQVKRDRDFVARLAGDEFALILDMSDGVAAVERIVRTIIKSVSQSATIAGKIVSVGASAGMVNARDALFDADEALRAADAALYEAKQSGRGTALWYDRQMDLNARYLRTLTVDLRKAIGTNQFSLAYQPIVDFRLGRVVACEALARWAHPEFGNISPAVFIRLAEQSGLIHDLGTWALRQACRDIRDWGEDSVKIAVNISPLQFKTVSLVDTVMDVLAETGVTPDKLEIEITESAIASDPAAMKVELQQLADIGIGISLDDFGTGYSSLSLVHSLPISKVKLDRSFIAALDLDPSLIRLISSIVQMAQTMKKQLVIEGVETHPQLVALAEAQARFVQGFYFCRPLAIADVISFARDFSLAHHDPRRPLGEARLAAARQRA